MRISDWSSDVCSSDLGKPHAFTVSSAADPIHAVIPVAGTDQGKPMRSETIGMRKRPVAVVEAGPGVSADVKSRVAVAFIGRERRRLHIGHLPCKNPRVACRLHLIPNRLRVTAETVRTSCPSPPVTDCDT